MSDEKKKPKAKPTDDAPDDDAREAGEAEVDDEKPEPKAKKPPPQRKGLFDQLDHWLFEAPFFQ